MCVSFDPNPNCREFVFNAHKIKGDPENPVNIFLNSRAHLIIVPSSLCQARLLQRPYCPTPIAPPSQYDRNNIQEWNPFKNNPWGNLLDEFNNRHIIRKTESQIQYRKSLKLICPNALGFIPMGDGRLLPVTIPVIDTKVQAQVQALNLQHQRDVCTLQSLQGSLFSHDLSLK